MEVSLKNTFISFGMGMFGYWINTFSIQPILRYRDIRNKVLMDFIYYAQVIKSDGLNDDMKNLHRERILSNRKTSAELTAAILGLPGWYLLYLKFKGHKPTDAAKHLITFSSTFEYEKSHEIESFIRRRLGLPEKS